METPITCMCLFRSYHTKQYMHLPVHMYYEYFFILNKFWDLKNPNLDLNWNLKFKIDFWILNHYFRSKIDLNPFSQDRSFGHKKNFGNSEKLKNPRNLKCWRFFKNL